MKTSVLATLCAGTLAGLLAPTGKLAAQDDASRAVEETLDAFHRAASEADGATYFDLFDVDGVFLGTDATERWTVEEFRAYAEPFFSQGRGWTYTPLERHVSVAPGGDVAWFDERLTNASLGETRGSGVLLREGDRWKVAQYNLTIPIPNEMAGDVARRIREMTADEPEADGADE
ncbi:MAG: nuclear transport factor 2 family protein [Gemmatimonadota bacterium]